MDVMLLRTPWSGRRRRPPVVRRQFPGQPEPGPMPLVGPPGPSAVSPPASTSPRLHADGSHCHHCPEDR